MSIPTFCVLGPLSLPISSSVSRNRRCRARPPEQGRAPMCPQPCAARWAVQVSVKFIHGDGLPVPPPRRVGGDKGGATSLTLRRGPERACQDPLIYLSAHLRPSAFRLLSDAPYSSALKHFCSPTPCITTPTLQFKHYRNSVILKQYKTCASL